MDLSNLYVFFKKYKTQEIWTFKPNIIWMFLWLWGMGIHRKLNQFLYTPVYKKNIISLYHKFGFFILFDGIWDGLGYNFDIVVI